MDIAQVQEALVHVTQLTCGSSVLIPLIASGDGLSVLLEVRAASLVMQPGEVCLPGGHIEPEEFPLNAAVREACEELLVRPEQIKMLGVLPPMEGPGGLPLHVFVAELIGYRETFSRAEVDRTFCLSLDWLLAHEPITYEVSYRLQFPDNFPWDAIPQGRDYPWRVRTHEVPFYEGTSPLVWGATARVLQAFVNTLRESNKSASCRNEPLDIRLAQPRDLAALVALYYEVSDAMIDTPYDCCWRKDIHPSRDLIERFVLDGGMLVATEGDELVGAAGLDHDLGHDYGPLPWLVDAPDEEVSVVHLLAVRPDQRGKGLSKALLDSCVEEARRRGMRTMRLDVTYNNEPAKALYQKKGFAFVGSGTQEIGPDEDPFVRLDVLELPLQG